MTTPRAWGGPRVEAWEVSPLTIVTARTDDELMLAHAAGDPRAFDELARRHQGRLTGFLRHMLRDEALAEDAVIETLFKLHRGAPTYRPEARFMTYLYTIAYREGVSLLRRVTRGVHRRAEPLADGDGAIPCYRPAPDASLAQRQALRAVEQALATLPAVQRSVFILYYREGMPTADIAAAVDIPPGSVRAYLSMARKAIRERLPDEAAEL